MRRRPFSSLFLPGALLFHVLFSNVPAILSTAVNRSIDDSLGDSVTGQRPIFLPSTAGVWEDNTCTGCALQPPTTSAFDGTFTAATYNPGLGNMSITFDFSGTAIYIFFILANNPAPGITATTAANFTIDGSLVGTYSHAPNISAPDFQFNQSALAFSKTALTNDTHQMIISTSGLSENVWVNFDYALYTFQEGIAVTSSASESSTESLTTTSATSSASSPSNAGVDRSSKNTGAIAGGVIAGLVALVALIAAIFVCRRRQRQSGNADHESNANSSTIPQELNPFMVSSDGEQSGSAPMKEYQSSSLGPPSQSFFGYGKVFNKTATFPTTRSSSNRTDVDTTQNQSQYTESSLGVSDTMISSGDLTPQYQNRSVIHTLPSGRTVMTAGTSRDFPPLPLPVNAVPSLTPAPDTKAELRHRRQQELERQMRVINEEIEDLKTEAAERAEGRDAPSVSPPNVTSASETVVSRKSTRKSTRGIEDVEQMRQQIRAMSEQIAFLQSQQNSAWAQGLSDEPPPGYSSNPVDSTANEVQ